MPTIQIRGIPVEFPHSPYQCQITYMTKVVECLETRKYALLESPTGTGKTLCLLCAAIAWRNAYIKKFRSRMPVPEVKTETQVDPVAANSPRIIYASRTHSQLTQAINELKSTAYTPVIAVIGSREQLCIHPQVSKLQNNSDKVNLCRSKIKSRSCQYHNNLDKAKNKRVEGMADIEDLVMRGLRGGFCPYFMAREMKEVADVVFMPYNYILDPKLRKMNGVDIQNSIVILDEGHNVENTCEEAASFELSSLDIASCLSDVDAIIKRRTDPQFAQNREAEAAEELKLLLGIKSILLDFESHMDSISIPTNEGVTKPGDFIFLIFQRCGIRFDTVTSFLDKMESAVALQSAEGERFGLQRSTQSLQKFMDSVKVVFSEFPTPDVDPTYFAKKISRFYKVFIRKEVKSYKGETWLSGGGREYKVLSYWCFCAGAAIHDVIKKEIWSLLLTSGTLSPLDAFSSELQVNFPIQLKNPHVIGPEQMWVGVVKSGPDSVELSSVYHNRTNVAYQSSLGNAISTFSRVIPKGMLVFFPSYSSMNECTSHWRDNGITESINSCKHVFEEPRGKTDFNAVMDAYSTTISNPALPGAGAVFLGVCRGKISEGMDFSDNNGRGVVITGLPFPPKNDPRVRLKMEFLNEAQSLKGEKFLTGSEWYKQQASRSVNQAIGRVIRHKHDFGAILLCDTRFSYPVNISQLPCWIQPSVKIYGKFSEAVVSLKSFFSEKDLSVTMPGKPKNVPTALEFANNTRAIVRERSKRKFESASSRNAKYNKVEYPVQVSQEALDKLNGPKLEGSVWDNMDKLSTERNEIDVYSAPCSKSSIFEGISVGKETIVTKPQTSRYKSIATKLVSQMSGDKLDFEFNPIGLTGVTSTPIKSPPKLKQAEEKPKIKNLEEKKARAANLISRVKSDLTTINYIRLTTAIQSYHQERDGELFISELIYVFQREELRHYLEEFDRFMQPEHIQSYKLKSAFLCTN